MIAETTQTLPVAEEVRAMQAMMTADEARAAAGRIRLSVGDLRRMLLDFEERRGYMALGYQNMRLCAEHEFGWPKSQFYRQLKAIDVERSMHVPIGDLPESHARELARLPAAQRADAYSAAGVGATAADVRAEVERRLPREETLPPSEPAEVELAPDLCEHGNPIEGYCRPCEDEYIDREQRRLENLPEMAPPLTACAYCGRPGAGAVLDGEPWCGECEELAGVVTETVGSRPAPQSPGRALSRDSDAPSPSRRSQDPPAPLDAAEIDDDEAWTAGLIDRAFFQKRGMSLADALRVARAVVETAENPDAGSRRRMAARAWLKGEVE